MATEKVAKKELQKVLDEGELSAKDFSFCADTFCKKFGVITDMQKNTLIAQAMCANKHIKSVEIFYDTNNMSMTVQAFVSRWMYYWSSKKKLKRILEYIYNATKNTVTDNIKIGVEIKIHGKVERKEKPEEAKGA